MNKLCMIAIFGSCLLFACQGSMHAISVDQRETLAVSYSDGMGTRDIRAVSSEGETFSGTLIWIKDPGTSGRYLGALIGDKGRTLQIELECNTFTAKCVGTARDNNGYIFFIK